MKSLLLQPRAVFRFLRDPQAPKLPKLGLLVAVLYAVMPVDAIPDLMPFIGWLDDAGVLALAGGWLLSAVNRHEHSRVRGECAST